MFADLGTICGYAMGMVGCLTSGEWNCTPNRFDSSGMRLVYFRRHLEEAYAACRFTHVAYEEVRSHAGVDAAHWYGAFLGVLQVFCLDHGIPYESVAVGTLKKFWTGKGNASKPQMIAATQRRCGMTPVSHNEADAIAGWHWLQAKFPDELVAQAAAK